MNSLRPSVIALAAALFLTGCAQLPADAPLTLTVLHTNDTHAYAAGIDRRDRACLDDAACTGGYARLAEAIAARKAQTTMSSLWMRGTSGRERSFTRPAVRRPLRGSPIGFLGTP